MPPTYLLESVDFEEAGSPLHAPRVARAVFCGLSADPENFHFWFVPDTGEAGLGVLRRVLAPGWEEFATPHALPNFNEHLNLYIVGVDIVRDGFEVNLTRAYPFDAQLPGFDYGHAFEIVHDVARLMSRMERLPELGQPLF
jgi:hypothetical protein